LRRLSSLDALV